MFLNGHQLVGYVVKPSEDLKSQSKTARWCSTNNFLDNKKIWKNLAGKHEDIQAVAVNLF